MRIGRTHVAEAFPPARQGTIINNHPIIRIATNISMVPNCALVTHLMMTAEVRLPDTVYPGHNHTDSVRISFNLGLIGF